MWNEYVGIPYKAGGRDRAGCDCYGLVRLVLAERFNVELPELSDAISHGFSESAYLIDENMPLVGLKPVSYPRAGDVVLLKIAGLPCHVGVYLGDGLMLHTLMEHDSAIDRVDGPRWARRIEGYYRG